MTLKIIDKKTGKEPTQRVIDNIAKKQGLMVADLDQFAVCEDGQIILLDDCGRIAYCDMKRFEVSRKKGKWIEYEVDVAPHPLHCSICGFSNHHICNRYMREFRRCPNCGAEMEVNNADSD